MLFAPHPTFWTLTIWTRKQKQGSEMGAKMSVKKKCKINKYNYRSSCSTGWQSLNPVIQREEEDPHKVPENFETLIIFNCD